MSWVDVLVESPDEFAEDGYMPERESWGADRHGSLEFVLRRSDDVCTRFAVLAVTPLGSQSSNLAGWAGAEDRHGFVMRMQTSDAVVTEEDGVGRAREAFAAARRAAEGISPTHVARTARPSRRAAG